MKSQLKESLKLKSIIKKLSHSRFSNIVPTIQPLQFNLNKYNIQPISYEKDTQKLLRYIYSNHTSSNVNSVWSFFLELPSYMAIIPLPFSLFLVIFFFLMW